MIARVKNAIGRATTANSAALAPSSCLRKLAMLRRNDLPFTNTVVHPSHSLTVDRPGDVMVRHLEARVFYEVGYVGLVSCAKIVDTMDSITRIQESLT